ncbi:MAG: ATP-dependent Clp protease adaptor ClpS [Dehalococcoidia bacterium]|nr:ATP-dependent Clp protease adaptor ClpS [Dehalococcoidia bacterium]
MATLPNPGTHVLEDTGTDQELDKPWHLVLLDDDHHTYQYVIAMVNAVFGYGPEKGFAIACMVDSQGQAILMTGGRDEVELKQQLVHAFGPDPLMETSAGSMTAIIEQVP